MVTEVKLPTQTENRRANFLAHLLQQGREAGCAMARQTPQHLHDMERGAQAAAGHAGAGAGGISAPRWNERLLSCPRQTGFCSANVAELHQLPSPRPLLRQCHLPQVPWSTIGRQQLRARRHVAQNFTCAAVPGVRGGKLCLASRLHSRQRSLVTTRCMLAGGRGGELPDCTGVPVHVDYEHHASRLLHHPLRRRALDPAAGRALQ
eukprot:1873100-Rhodomonas_salina.1